MRRLGIPVKRKTATIKAGLSASVCWGCLCFLLVTGCIAQSQTTPKCPVAHRLTLEQVRKFLVQKEPEKRTVDLIQACNVSFSLDAPSLEQLVDAGMTEGEFNVLNPETAAGLTVDQAHVEVAGLEAYVAGPNSTLAAQRDAELQKLNAQYQTERAKAAKVPPKDPFTSTADYNAQVQRAQAAATEVDRNHETAVAQVNADYQSKLDLRNTPFLARIEFLKKSEYRVAVSATFNNYNADTQRLTATIGGEEYWFDTVPGDTARRLNENWKSVAVEQPYAEDALKTRMLRLAGTGIEVSGALHSAQIAEQLRDAQLRMDEEDYDGAATVYQAILAVDPNNQPAKVGIEKVNSQKEAQKEEAALKTQKQKTFLAGLNAAGIWLDTKTNLMWITQDSDPVDWQQASAYCKAFRGGSFPDWRLPSIGQLRGIYDPGSSAYVDRVHGFIHVTKPDPYHIMGGIKITTSTWSSNAKDGQVAYLFSFFTGGVYTDSERIHERALCVRTYQPDSDGLDAPAPVAAASTLPQISLNPENSSSAPLSDFVGTWVGTMHSATGQSFPVMIRLNEITTGDWCGTIHHPPPLDADGRLLCMKLEGGTLTVSQTITRGRERCLDGVNVLTLVDHDTMERVWIDPATGVGRDKGLLKRQKE